MKKAIVVVYHGSANEEINNITSTILTNEIKNIYSSYDTFEVFTSKIVLHRLVNKRFDFEQCLSLLITKNYQSVSILVTNLISGVELDNIKNLLENTKLNYQITPALFEDKNNIIKIAKILTKENNQINLFIGHGSKRKNNEEYLSLEHSFIEQGVSNHYVCVIDGKPTYDEIEMKLDKTKSINIYPLMFIAGYHAIKDVSVLAQTLTNTFPHVEYHNISLGMIPEIRQIYLNNLTKILEAIE